MAGFIQVTGNVTISATQGTIPVPVTKAASAGNTLIGVAKGSLGATTSSVSDTQGNTWTVDAQGEVSAGPNCAVIRSVLTTSLSTSDTITVTMSATNGYNIGAIICEYEGAYSTADVTANTSDSASVASLPLTAGSATGHDGELVVTGVGTGGTSDQAQGFGVSATTPSMTIRAQSPSSPGICNAAMADGTASGTVTPSVTWTWPTSTSAAIAMASYVSPAAPAPKAGQPVASPVAALIAARAI